MCIFNCGIGNCKTGAPHHCRLCGAKDAHFKSQCPKNKSTKSSYICKSCGRDTAETKRDECKMPNCHININ